MFFPILLAALFVLAPLAEAGQAPNGPTHAEAARIAGEGRNAEALAAFQRLAAANPSDQVARLWIARLHARMGHQERAEPVYRSVLLEDPNSVEAMTGVAAALIARHEPERALELLERAAKLAPSNDEVLSLTGRARQQQGRSSDAITYFERAVEIAPTPPRRQTLEAARLSHLSRVDLRGVSEMFDEASPDSRGGDINLNIRLSDAVRIIGRGQVERQFEVDEQRGGGGIEWRVKPTTLLRGQVLVGPDNVVLPEGDVLGEIEHSYKNALWIGTVRHFTFNGASTTFISPAVDWMATDRLSIGLRYALSFTDIGTFVSMEPGQTLHVRPVYRISPRVSLQGGYAIGVESFEDFAIDRIGDFRAQTLSGGIRFNLPMLTSIAANYEQQFWRRDDVRFSRVTLSLSQRF
jgi:Flp pilus assembly protein TadD